jgi:hypothetical protein
MDTEHRTGVAYIWICVCNQWTQENVVRQFAFGKQSVPLSSECVCGERWSDGQNRVTLTRRTWIPHSRLKYVHFRTYSLLRVGRHSDLLQAGRSEDRTPVGARYSAPVQTGPGVRPASFQCAPRLFPRG